MSWGFVAAAAISAVGAYAGSRSQSRAQRQTQQNYANSLEALLAGAGPEVFGSVPEHVPYEPVDITQSQLDTIQGNLTALPYARALSRQVNREVIRNDLTRIRALVPGYDEKLGLIMDESTMNLRGDTNLPDYFDNVIRNRAEAGAALGTPGTYGSATARDLGLSQMDLMDRGNSMFQNWLQTANAAVSPIQSQMRPQEMFFTPQQRLEADILQAQLKQQSGQSAANLAAMPDPTAAGIFNARLSTLGATTPIASPNPLGPALQAAGGVMQAYAGRSGGGGYQGASVATQQQAPVYQQAPRQGTGYYGVPMQSGYGQPQGGYGTYGYANYGVSLDSPPRTTSSPYGVGDYTGGYYRI